MNHLTLFTNSHLKKILKKRSGESKFGEHVVLFKGAHSIYDQLRNLDVDFVIFGIKEDIGIRANYGKPGAYNAFDSAINFLLNTQSNQFANPKKVAVLGTLNFNDFMTEAVSLDTSNKDDLKKLRAMVAEIDKVVTQLVTEIRHAGKTPIAIGGGHNNAYGMIKGSSLALKKPINCINFDAHTDLRAEEGRHSGNGFTYALTEGFLDTYSIFGLHENYTSQIILDFIAENKKKISYTTFEAIAIKKSIGFGKALKTSLATVNKAPFGIELDCDAIEAVPSSAKTPSGFSVNQARRFVHMAGSQKNAVYLHLCEAAPTKKDNYGVGRLLSYLITDFIKAKS